MKHSLLRYCIAIAVAVLFLSTKAISQCNFVGPVVQVLNSKDSIGTGDGLPYCVRVIDLFADININGGNKFVYIHLWTTPNWHKNLSNVDVWPTYNYNTPGEKPPTRTASGGGAAGMLIKDLFTVGIDYHGAPVLLSTYGPDPAENSHMITGVTLTQTPSVANPGSTTFKIHNIKIVTPGVCDPAITFKGDMWAGQDAGDKALACGYGGFTFATSDPTVSGMVLCGATTRVLNFDVMANGAGNNIKFDFDVYADMSAGNTDGFNPSLNTQIYSGTKTITPTDTRYAISNGGAAPQVLHFTSAATAPPGYISIPAIYPASFYNAPGGTTHNLYIVIKNIQIINGATTTNIDNGLVTFISPACAGPLAANYGTINASVKSGSLNINWQTLTETDCKEFLVEASKDGVTNWVTIGKVSSKSADGNSNELLQYNFGGALPSALAGLVVSLLLIPVVRSRAGKIVMIVAFLGFLGACVKGKKDLNIKDGDSVYIRISQINSDNTVGTISKVIKVTRE